MEQPQVVIIGAGIGGMTMAIALRRMGLSNFTIIERASEVGGTWRIRKQYSVIQKWFLKNVPGYLRVFRAAHYLWGELMYLVLFGNRLTNRCAERYIKAYMMRATPAEYLNQVIPSDSEHNLGCKRVVIGTNYLASLARPHLSLVWDPIESITEYGILTKKGKVIYSCHRLTCISTLSLKPFDVIIYSTGYITDGYFIDIQGSAGQTVTQYYEAHGGPTAYLGTTLPGFPNFFIISGANTSSGHTSRVFALEVQVVYILQLITPIIDGHISSVEVTTEATDEYNRKIQARLSGFVWSKCHFVCRLLEPSSLLMFALVLVSSLVVYLALLASCLIVPVVARRIANTSLYDVPHFPAFPHHSSTENGLTTSHTHHLTALALSDVPSAYHH
ncbi:hypothetical protein B0H11DRAFT_2234308 [Mycena galericulata]|nr:hypothetical protein B0H11DRAFT_2234308 [Mycena galericulata]